MARRARTVLLILVLLAFTLLAGAVRAGSANGGAVDKSVMSGGGAPAASSSGAVALNGTLGQTAIGPAAAGALGLGAGFWVGLSEARYEVYLPLVLRND